MRSRAQRAARGPSRRRPAAAAAVLTIALAIAAAPPTAPAATGCVTALPVRITLPDGPFAAAYVKEVRVRVDSGARRIRNVRAELFTFSGRRMGASGRPRAAVRGAGTLTLRLERDFAPMQVGGFTLVVRGEPNASRSCGPKATTRVLQLRGCRERLPVSFPHEPGGDAADYEGYLSVPVRSRGPLIRDLTSSVYGFDGALLGHADAPPVLFGEMTLDHALLRPLTPGRYTVVVEGLLDEQPRSCGRKRAHATMTFR